MLKLLSKIRFFPIQGAKSKKLQWEKAFYLLYLKTEIILYRKYIQSQ